MRLDETSAAVPPPTGLLAWLLDRDERVRRVLWVLYPACAVAIVALLMLGSSAAMLPAVLALCHVGVAVARGRAGRTMNTQEDVPTQAPTGEVEAAEFACAGQQPDEDADAA